MTDSKNTGHSGEGRPRSGGFNRGASNRGGKPGFSKGRGAGGYGRKDGDFRGKPRGGQGRDFGDGKRDGDRGGFRGDRKPAGQGGKRNWTPSDKQGGSRGYHGDRKPFDKDARGFKGDRGSRGNGENRGFNGERSFDKGSRDFKGFSRGGFDKKDFGARGGRGFGDKPRVDKPRRDGDSFDRDRKPRLNRDAQRTFDRDSKPGFERGGDTPRGEKRFDDRKGRGDRRGHDAGRGHRNPVLSPARQAACAIGREVRERDAFVSEVIPGVLAQFEGMSAEDSAFATKIARGVTATLGTLDEFIDRNLNSPSDIQDDVRDALRVSAYELLFLGKADYAAVDQGVELVCWVAPKAGGLANAVLRKMAKSAKAFPFGRPNLSLQVLARSQAFPLWLAKRLMNEMGLQNATTFMRASNADAPVYIAINAIKVEDAEEIIEVLDQAGSLLTPVEDVPGCYLVVNARVLAKPEVRSLFEQGKVLVSDASAQAVAALACPDHDIEAFLEIGSGRGTKTILLQSDAVRAFGRTMPMVSVDDHGFKAEILSKRVAGYGIESVRPVKADGRKLSTLMPEASFDAVLLDAPCSGVGTLRRHPEIRWRLTEKDVTAMAGVELDMLIEAAKMVKPGGILTYATCTVFNEENQQVVERFLKTKLGESFQEDTRIEPALTAKGPDAHFAVRFKRVR